MSEVFPTLASPRRRIFLLMKSGDILHRGPPAGGAAADSPTVGFNPSLVGVPSRNGPSSGVQRVGSSALLRDRERWRGGGRSPAVLPLDQRIHDQVDVRDLLH